MKIQEHIKDGFVISTDPKRLQSDEIFAFLSRSYWAENRSEEVVALSFGTPCVSGFTRRGGK